MTELQPVRERAELGDERFPHPPPLHGEKGLDVGVVVGGREGEIALDWSRSHVPIKEGLNHG
jgi:hypothetical protein